MVTVYVPARRPLKEYWPLASVCVLDEPMDTVTVAPVEDSQYCIDNAWGSTRTSR